MWYAIIDREANPNNYIKTKGFYNHDNYCSHNIIYTLSCRYIFNVIIILLLIHASMGKVELS